MVHGDCCVEERWPSVLPTSLGSSKGMMGRQSQLQISIMPEPPGSEKNTLHSTVDVNELYLAENRS